MTYTTDSAEWPSGYQVPVAVKALVDRLYSLLDSDASNVGDILANEIFTSDGVAFFGGSPSRGTEEIRKSRDNAWVAISSRKHTVQRVYVNSKDADDLLFVANVEMGLRNGKHVAGPFAGRLVISEPQSAAPKLKLYQVWGDSGPLVKALQEK